MATVAAMVGGNWADPRRGATGVGRREGVILADGGERYINTELFAGRETQ